MSRLRSFVGTRLRQLSDVTGDLQDWLWNLADRIEEAPGATTARYAGYTWRQTASGHSRRDIPIPLIGVIHPYRCDQDGRVGPIALTAQQREALRRVGEQVQAVNRQVVAMREARRKRDRRHG